MDIEVPKTFCNFSIETPIYDIDLPNKIKDKLISLDVHPEPGKVYRLNVSFEDINYYIVDFYRFPVEWKQWEIEKLEKLEKAGKIDERADIIRTGVLSQQLENICNALEPFNIDFAAAAIMGKSIDGEENRVDFDICETSPTSKWGYSKNRTKANQEESKCVPRFIIPNIDSFANNLAKVLERIAKQHEENENKKQQEKSQHTPNMKDTKEIFTALATAILKDCPNKSLSPENLSREMLVQAQIESDWPLEIRGYANSLPMERSLIPKREIDCP